MRHGLKALGLVALLAVGSQAVNAETVTINAVDFPAGGLYTSNITVKGFRFSPNYHYDIASEGGIVWLGSDTSGYPTLYNPDFLGPSELELPSGNSPQPWPVVFIDAGGHPFSLLEMTFWGKAEGVSSSKGGLFSGLAQFPNPYLTHAFEGPEWTGIEWIMLRGSSGAPTFGMVSMTAQGVPEPGTLVLLSLGLLALVFVARRKRK